MVGSQDIQAEEMQEDEEVKAQEVEKGPEEEMA